MTDTAPDVAAIRAALAQGPTPGPWHTMSRGSFWHEEEADVRSPDGEDVGGAEMVQPIGNVPTTRGQVWMRDAAYIAACHPERIARLLDALDEARKDAARLDWMNENPNAVRRSTGYLGSVSSWTVRYCDGAAHDFSSIRNAIDAAMKEAP